MTDAPHALHIVSEPPLASSANLDAIYAVTGPAARLILRERMDQVEKHGFDIAHDDAHDDGEIALGAYSYLRAGLGMDVSKRHKVGYVPLADWPWANTELFKPTDVLTCYVKAAAMLMAEADRLIRARAMTEHMGQGK